MKRNIITLPDGYNGHTIKFYADPVEEDGKEIKLQCAEPGRKYIELWFTKDYIHKFTKEV